jgi:benzoyl-CoA reductase/2-hydroxyglutaryl-CoA dehydratase subunit BcrC/BadD/HgdB
MIEDIFTKDTFDPEIPSIGWTCTYTPEEVISAGGFQPVRIAESTPSTKLADVYFHSNLCPYARSCLDFGLKNKSKILKGIVIAHSCNAMRIFYHYWSQKVAQGSFVHFLNVPRKTDAAAVDYFAKEIHKLKSAMEAFFEISIGEKVLSEAIDVYNKTRDMMTEVYAMRKEKSLPLKATQLFRVIQAGQRMSRRKFNNILEGLIEEIKNQKKKASSIRQPRILITGSLLSSPQLLEIVENAGADVVYEDLCTGSRYFDGRVEKETDLIRSLALHYLKKSPCPRMKDTDLRLGKIRERIQEFAVDGLIYNTVKFCDNHLYDFPVFKETLEDSGIPVLQIEDDFTGGNIGQIRTRVEAFVERL